MVEATVQSASAKSQLKTERDEVEQQAIKDLIKLD